MDIKRYKSVAQSIANTYLGGGGKLPDIAANAISQNNLNPQRAELMRLVEYINTAIQVALFDAGLRTEGFPLLTPEALRIAMQPKTILDIKDELPETRYEIPVTETPLERSMLEKAKRMKLLEYAQERAVADRIQSNRLKQQIKEVFGRQANLANGIAGEIASLIADISAPALRPEHAVRMIRIVRVELPPKLASIVERGVREYRDITPVEDTEVYQINEEHPFMKKIASLKKKIEEFEVAKRKQGIYEAAIRNGGRYGV